MVARPPTPHHARKPNSLPAKRETSRRSKAKRLASDGLKHKAYYLPAALLAKLDTYHRQTKKSRNQIVSEALAEYLNRHLP